LRSRDPITCEGTNGTADTGTHAGTHASAHASTRVSALAARHAPVHAAGYIRYPGEAPGRDRVLWLLASSFGRRVSGDEIGRALGMSRPAVWKHVQSLIAAGLPVEPVKGRGYRLIQPLDLIIPDDILRSLHTRTIGRTLFCAQETGSTNNDAKDMAGESPDGAVFMAEVQNLGKGRIGRTWSSPPGGVYMSILLKPDIPPSQAPGLALVAGYAVASTLRSLFGLDARVKWPNDVLVGGKKVCGVLCEMRAEADRVADIVVGIGINANVEIKGLPAATRETAASLNDLIGRTVDRSLLIANVLNSFEAAYEEYLRSGMESLARRITEIAAYLGQEVTVKNLTAAHSAETTGTFLGIDPQGRAVLKLPGGEGVAVSAGDLSLRVRRRSGASSSSRPCRP